MHVFVNGSSLRPGGGMTLLLGLLKGLSASHPQPRLTALVGDPTVLKHVEDSGTADEVQTVSGTTTKRFLWQQMGLGRQIQRTGADVVLTFNHYMQNIPVPQVVYHLNQRRFSRDYREPDLRNRLAEGLRDWSSRQALRHADANVFESTFLLDAARESFGRDPRNSHVFYIGLPDDVVDDSRRITPAFSGEPKLFAITSSNAHKDNPTLIRTLGTLCRRRPDVDWRLDVTSHSHGEWFAPLMTLAREWGVANRISWHRSLTGNDLHQQLRKSLCLVSASVMESYAMVALEAMAQHCPPIVANIASMPESVGQAGMLCRPHTEEEFATAVIQLYDNPEFRAKLVEAGLQHIEQLRWSVCGQQFQDLFHSFKSQTASAA